MYLLFDTKEEAVGWLKRVNDYLGYGNTGNSYAQINKSALNNGDYFAYIDQGCPAKFCGVEFTKKYMFEKGHIKIGEVKNV